MACIHKFMRVSALILCFALILLNMVSTSASSNKMQIRRTSHGKLSLTLQDLRGGSIQEKKEVKEVKLAPLSKKERNTLPGEGVNKLRDAIFPVYGSREMKKFFSISGMNFFIVFVLCTTRDAKDTLIVTSCGAEAISFLKLYGVLPAATLFMLYYSKLSTMLSKKQLFYVTAAPFFIFYILFDLVIYPMKDVLHPSTAPNMSGGLSFLAKIYQNWTFALFYIVSELYSAVSIGVLFWQHANDIVPVKQAKRFYPLFGQISSLAPIIAGQCVVRIAAKSSFTRSLHVLTTLITVSGIGIFSLFAYSNNLVSTEKGIEKHIASPKKKKAKLGMIESFKVLSKSKYLGCLATLVIAYGLAINFTDILFKSVLKLKYPDKLDYQRFMGNFTTTVGMTTFMIIFVGSNIVKHLGWRVGALMTPLMMAFVGIPFFSTIIMGDRSSSAGLAFAVLLGATQTLLSKATKFSFFDPTTQMAYIPLDEDSKIKGKAAIDGLGSRIGKSGGALLQQALVMVFGNILSAAPAIAVIYYLVLSSWMIAANELAVMFREKSQSKAGD